ncbi:MAG TPA: YceI family protein [Polyangiaceae bacterium]|nr:YceI family protein [Polyangiaceae bacterium]
MPRYTQNDAETLVFTFKDGLLSKVAHDLKIKVTSFSVDVDTTQISAQFDASSLRVVNAVHDNVEDPKALSDADKDKIVTQIQKEVLETDQHPSVRFISTKVARRPDGGYSVTGDLTLHGTTRPISAETRVEGGKQVAEVEIDQPEFGVVPFKAMMGTLKVKPVVRVKVSVPNA